MNVRKEISMTCYDRVDMCSPRTILYILYMCVCDGIHNKLRNGHIEAKWYYADECAFVGRFFKPKINYKQIYVWRRKKCERKIIGNREKIDIFVTRSIENQVGS